MVSQNHVNAKLQRQQAALYNTPFALELSKSIIRAKLKNQLTVLKRYGRYIATEEIEMISICITKIPRCIDIMELMGYEGTAARYYFSGLSKCVKDEFRFKGRSKRPPLDAFNAMLSMGYYILSNTMEAEIEAAGLNPYFGFMHRDIEKHATLVSDLIEEWRPIIVDSTVMAMINGNEVQITEFKDEEGAILMDKSALNRFLNKIQKKLLVEVKYLPYETSAVAFRRAIYLQLRQLRKAIEEVNPEIYTPIIIR